MNYSSTGFCHIYQSMRRFSVKEKKKGQRLQSRKNNSQNQRNKEKYSFVCITISFFICFFVRHVLSLSCLFVYVFFANFLFILASFTLLHLFFSTLCVMHLSAFILHLFIVLVFVRALRLSISVPLFKYLCEISTLPTQLLCSFVQVFLCLYLYGFADCSAVSVFAY